MVELCWTSNGEEGEIQERSHAAVSSCQFEPALLLNTGSDSCVVRKGHLSMSNDDRSEFPSLMMERDKRILIGEQ